MILGQDLDALRPDSRMLSLQAIVGASHVSAHQRLLSRSFLTKTLSCLKSPEVQSARSASSMFMQVAIRQESSVRSENRTWMYSTPSSNLCSTHSTTFPFRPRYWWPGANLRRADGIDLRLFTSSLSSSAPLLETIFFEAFDPSPPPPRAFAWLVLRRGDLRRTYPNRAG
jgi:hypothetical protein